MLTKGDKIIAGTGTITPLLTSIWSDHILNDISWLRADTFSWQSGEVYQAAYAHLENDLSSKLNLYASNTYYYSREKASDVISAVAPYAWKDIRVRIVFSISKCPSAEDELYQDSGAQQYSTAVRTVYGYTQETVAGIAVRFFRTDDDHKIVLSDQESNVEAIYNATGVAWYYMIDTANRRFKLPRTKFGFSGLRDSVGGYVEPGLPDHRHLVVATGSESSIGLTANNTVAQVSHWDSGYLRAGLNAQNKEADVGKSGLASYFNSVYGNSNTVQPPATQMYLYFYVGQFTQTAIEQTAGLNAELFNGKADLDRLGHIVVEFQEPTEANGWTWYRRYADGWVEQGGETTTSADITVILPISMRDIHYTLTVGGGLSGGVWPYGNISSTTTIHIGTRGTSGFAGVPTYWQVSGISKQN